MRRRFSISTIVVACCLTTYDSLLSLFPGEIKQIGRREKGWRRTINRLPLSQFPQIYLYEFPRCRRVSSRLEAKSMEIEVSCSSDDTLSKVNRVDLDSIRVKRKTLQNLLEDCQRALELLNLTDNTTPGGDEIGDDSSDGVGQQSDSPDSEEFSSSSDPGDPEADKYKLISEREHENIKACDSIHDSVTCFLAQFYDLIKSRVECQDFREKIELAQVSVSQDLAEVGSSWDVVSEDDVWGEGTIAQTDEDYVVVREEDIADGIACFMATYLSSLKQTKDISPDQLQKALSTMFSVKKRKGKLRKAWEGSKVIYNVASWSATAIGIYQNPMILSIASKAFWVSCKAISKLV
ncbi:unnamed protein product [Thlaspi arvense]|uniref:Uncharacterized protein n=1 Tax=Thlaspi arvense TaxID=13288 RepID=A0AAU9T3V5_THLAR|nr:unnamed protein product [Thlaspi arvense]